jgi:hypothetical protein
MRHVIGVILAVVMAGVLFFAGSWGYLRLLRLPGASLPAGGGSLLSNHNVLMAFGAVGVTGLLAGVLIAAPRISPLAAGLPGLALLAWTGLFLYRVHRAVSLIPLRGKAFGTGFEALGINGILAVAGLAMIIPLFVPSRWRTPRFAEYQPDYGVQPPATDSGLISSDWAPTSPQPTFRDPNEYPYR